MFFARMLLLAFQSDGVRQPMSDFCQVRREQEGGASVDAREKKGRCAGEPTKKRLVVLS